MRAAPIATTNHLRRHPLQPSSRRGKHQQEEKKGIDFRKTIPVYLVGQNQKALKGQGPYLERQRDWKKRRVRDGKRKGMCCFYKKTKAHHFRSGGKRFVLPRKKDKERTKNHPWKNKSLPFRRKRGEWYLSMKKRKTANRSGPLS